MKEWRFYGRQAERSALAAILARERWFFVKISGRRRIGKSTLVQQALADVAERRVLYVQIPDADPLGVLAAMGHALRAYAVPVAPPDTLFAMAACVGDLVRAGWTVILDEFQYFHRRALFPFTSFLQAQVDQIVQPGVQVSGGLIVLGSIHTEMSALLEDRHAPLYARLTANLDLGHLEPSTVAELLADHDALTPERLLFTWNLFEGVPKFYRDAVNLGVLAGDRGALMKALFFDETAPLKNEAEAWFLKELRGRYDPILEFIAQHSGCSHADIEAFVRQAAHAADHQVSGYVRVLRDRYRMIECLQPVFAKPTSRNGRYYLCDNFLRAWLGAIGPAVTATRFRAIGPLLADADARLADLEGHGLERLVGALYEERSRKGLGDFPLSARIHGYWDRQGTEIDLVALNEDRRTLRLGSCKRNPAKLVADLPAFDAHVGRFLAAMPRFAGWKVERVAVTPRHTADSRRAVQERGYLAEDLAGLVPARGFR